MKMRDRKGQGRRLDELPPEIQDRVDSRLTSGEPASSIATWLQDDCGYFRDVQMLSVKKMLDRYRGKRLRNKVMARITKATYHTSVKTLEKRLNALDELEEMVKIQRTRVDRMLAMEDGKPILLKATTDEIKLLKDMLVNLGSLQMETGYLARAPRTIKGVMKNPNGETIQEITWTEEQEALYQELERVASSSQAPA